MNVLRDAMAVGRGADPAVTRVVLPSHLRTLADLESLQPVLRSTLRDADGKRRAFVRFFACQEDLSHQGFDDPLPTAVLDGSEPFLVIGAMAGG